MRDQSPLQGLLDDAVSQAVFPGAQLSVRAGDIALDLCAGATALPEYDPASITPDTRFDIASLTKALCTSVLLMQAVDELGLDLDASVEPWFPRLERASEVTIGLLACHRAGLADHRHFYRTIAAGTLTDPGSCRFRMKELVEAEPLISAPGAETRYSDLGYMLLGWILEASFDRGLDALFRDQIASPLGLEKTSFGPVPEPVAATELDAGRPIAGVVHDENARATGGVEGHAGLFSTAVEVAGLTEHLREVHSGGRGLAQSRTIRTFWQPSPGSSFAFGWDTPTEPSSSGRYTTRGGAVGHLGFTGCSVWCDWVREVTVVLLTNRVHPTRANEAIKVFRPLLHDRVNEWLSLP